MTVEFQHLGIQCKRKRDIQKALEERKSIRVDPYRQGFDHSNSPGNIDLNAVKLCFQAFLESPEKPGKYASVIPKVCSETIFNRRNELQIVDMSSDKASAKGGKKLIILCEKIKKEDDIKVRFFQENTGWEAFGEFKPEDVHHQFAISLTVPPYMDGDNRENKQVWVELIKADGSRSKPKEFYFTPGGYGCGAVPSQECYYTPGGGPLFTPGGRAVPSTMGPEQVELLRRVETTPATRSNPNIYNGGNVQWSPPQTNPPSMQPLNMEGSQQRQERRGPACRDLDSTIVFVPRQMERQESNSLDISNEGNTFPKRSSKLTDLNQVQATQSYLQPYEYDNTMPQQSPNPQGMVNIALLDSCPINNQIPSIEEILGTKPMELKNMSQELQELTLDKPPSVQPLNMEASQQRQGKRAATEAKLDSGSKVVPRKEDKQSNSLNTPTNSDTLSSGDVRFTSKDLRDPSAVLKNCPEVNQL